MSECNDSNENEYDALYNAIELFLKNHTISDLHNTVYRFIKKIETDY